MADEASLRIVLEGDDAGAQPRGGRPSQSQGAPREPSGRPAGKKEIEPETVFDAFLEVARKLGDAIGGIFSKVGGVATNLASAFASATQAVLPTSAKIPYGTVIPPPQAIPVPKPPEAIPVPKTAPVEKYNMKRAQNVFQDLLDFNVGGAFAVMVNPDFAPLKKLFDQGKLKTAADVYAALNPQMAPPPTAQLVPPPPTAQLAPTIAKQGLPPLPPAAGKGAAAAASSGGGTAAALGAAAGPVAVVLAAVAAAKAFYESMAGAVKGVGDFTASLLSANSDVSANITNLGSAAESTAGAFGYFGSAAKVAAAAIGAFGKVMSAIDANVERYAGFSPQIAQAQAVSELRNVFGEFRRAAEVGPDLVRYIEARTELQQRFEDTKVRILSQILPAVLGFMNLFQTALPMLEQMATLFAGLAGAIPFFNQQQQNQLGDINRILQQMAQAGVDMPTNLVMQNGFPFTLGPGGAGGPSGAGATPLPPLPGA